MKRQNVHIFPVRQLLLQTNAEFTGDKLVQKAHSASELKSYQHANHRDSMQVHIFERLTDKTQFDRKPFDVATFYGISFDTSGLLVQGYLRCTIVIIIDNIISAIFKYDILHIQKQFAILLQFSRVEQTKELEKKKVIQYR